ncbi:hypothetical protein PVAP13_4NG099317 [Panicum virgatum]|uniref:Uncharacterized protein n=1 Tax=Panicum virgatum TaxID=38727 RepID=A0A8T0TAS5_PANVG|nr:hypothetical protein PVAP13_4NG099317 [Panicum virgatum]
MASVLDKTILYINIRLLRRLLPRHIFQPRGNMF